MPAPMTHDYMDMEVSSATTQNNSVNAPINYLIGREIGTDDAIEIEDSMRIESGAMGDRFWGVPGGSTGQRPTGAAGQVRFNTTLENLDIHDGSGWTNPLTIEAVTAANLDANGDVGDGDDQVAAGDHTHPLTLVDSGAVNVVGTDTIFLTGTSTDKIYQWSGTVWDDGLDVPAAELLPSGLAVKSNGNLLVVGRTNNLVYEYDGTDWDAGLAGPANAVPQGLAVRSNGNILLLHQASIGTLHFIYEYDGTNWDNGLALPAGVTTPRGLAVKANGNILLAVSNRIYEYNGSAWDGGFAGPTNEGITGIGIKANGNVLVSGSTNDAIYEYNGSTWSEIFDVPAGEGNPAGLTVLHPQQNLAVMSGTVSGRGVLNLEVATTSRNAQPTVAVTIGGAAQTADDEIESDNNDVKLWSFRAEVDDGDAYAVTVTATADGGAAAIAFLNAGARV